MKWFQHQAVAHTDAKLQKVLMKYGFEGYGLYWYCIESICQNLEPRLTFELEQDSEILAHIGRMDSRIVEEIMVYMVNIGLFSESDGTIICRTLARYLGDNLTRNPELKAVIKAEKESVSQTVSDSLRLSQQEEKRREEKTGHKDKGRKRPTKPIPDDFQVTGAMVAWANEKGFGHVNLAAATDEFIDYWRGQGDCKADWVAAWRNKIRKQAEYEERQQYGNSKRAGVSAAIHGHH